MDWPLVHARHLGRYDDLIFTPLDLPSPPVVDAKAFVEWMGRIQDPSVMAPKLAFEQVDERAYPWLMRTFMGDLSPICEAFPEVYDYLLLYPFESLHTVVFLAQRGHQSVFTHCDPDGLYGMRFYLTAKNAEGLHFYKARQRFDFFPTYARNADGELVHADWDRYFHMDQRNYATLPDETKAFTINSARAAHAVDANTCELGERIAVLVRGHYDPARRDELLERSLRAYGQHAIWYEELSA